MITSVSDFVSIAITVADWLQQRYGGDDTGEKTRNFNGVCCMSAKMCNFAYDNGIYNIMKKWQKILDWIMIKLVKPKVSMEPKTQRACGIYRTTKQYIFLTGYGKTGMGYKMSYPIKFTPIDCDDVELHTSQTLLPKVALLYAVPIAFAIVAVIKSSFYTLLYSLLK